MMRWIGFAVLVLSAIVVFRGWAAWSEMRDEASTLSGMREVSAKGPRSVRTGDTVVVWQEHAHSYAHTDILHSYGATIMRTGSSHPAQATSQAPSA